MNAKPNGIEQKTLDWSGDCCRRTAIAMERVLQGLADSPTEEILAMNLIESFDGNWRAAYQWLCIQREEIASGLRILALTVALEGKEREQQPTKK